MGTSIPSGDPLQPPPIFQGKVEGKKLELKTQSGQILKVTVKDPSQQKHPKELQKDHVHLKVYNPETGVEKTVAIHQTQFINRKEIGRQPLLLGLSGQDQTTAINRLAGILEIAHPETTSELEEMESLMNDLSPAESQIGSRSMEDLDAIMAGFLTDTTETTSHDFSFSGFVDSERHTEGASYDPSSVLHELEEAMTLASGSVADDLDALIAGFESEPISSEEIKSVSQEMADEIMKYVQKHAQNWTEPHHEPVQASGLPYAFTYIPEKGTFIHLHDDTIEGGAAKILQVYNPETETTQVIRMQQGEDKLTETEKQLHKQLQGNDLFVAGRTITWKAGKNEHEGVLMPKMKTDLAAYMRKNPISDADLVNFGLRGAKALAHLHSLNHLHLDVHPGNLMFDSTGQLRLGDFGISAPFSDPGMRPGHVTGTSGYLAPEVVQMTVGAKSAIDEKTDIWQWGVSMLQLANPSLRTQEHFDPFHQLGQPYEALPFTQQENIDKVVNEYLPKEEDRTPLQNLIARSLQVDQSKRPTAQEIVTVLQEVS